MAKKTAKAKAAMANRGTFDSKHTDHGKPIHYKVAAAVEPFTFASAAASKVWAIRWLIACRQHTRCAIVS